MYAGQLGAVLLGDVVLLTQVEHDGGEVVEEEVGIEHGRNPSSGSESAVCYIRNEFMGTSKN